MSTISAEVKKKENIAEYIIYMYQTEDLILNFDFNLDDILEYVIQHMSRDPQVLKEQLLWYADIIEQMKNENIADSKERLRSTQVFVNQLTSLHEKHLVAESSYQDRYAKAKKDIESNIALSENTIVNPVQICLNGIYGMLLLKLNGKKISDDQQSMLENFGSVLEYLSEEYKKENSK
ncbi:MAG: DUF4924 domain-containing protein [Bacteroidetes bacterium]|nr:MAG: DUF4924 domain-containing protein [Bacteroidota bacterium]